MSTDPKGRPAEPLTPSLGMYAEMGFFDENPQLWYRLSGEQLRLSTAGAFQWAAPICLLVWVFGGVSLLICHIAINEKGVEAVTFPLVLLFTVPAIGFFSLVAPMAHHVFRAPQRKEDEEKGIGAESLRELRHARSGPDAGGQIG